MLLPDVVTKYGKAGRRKSVLCDAQATSEHGDVKYAVRFTSSEWQQVFPVERRLSRSLQALQAAVSEKAAAVAALSSRLEQQQAEHAQALQALRAEFAQERQALAERAQADREASTAALQARLTAAERARQEGAAKAEEQERLVKEGKRREARLQETNRALVRLLPTVVHTQCWGNGLGRICVLPVVHAKKLEGRQVCSKGATFCVSSPLLIFGVFFLGNSHLLHCADG